MALHNKIAPQWQGQPCFVLATGPSLTSEVVHKIRMARMEYQWNALLINDAYKLAPWADALYAADNGWWGTHGDCFRGQKWACHQDIEGNSKLHLVEKLGLNLVRSKDGDTFSTDQSVIHHGSNSGFQAINLAMHFGCKFIVLVGFDMRIVDGNAHFFGRHPDPLGNGDDRTYSNFASAFHAASKSLPEGVTILNATPNSALKCFPMVSIGEAIERYNRLHWDRPESNSVTS